eukprot:scaffold25960_cov53-Phaeocystis_antarctica.AAC.3
MPILGSRVRVRPRSSRSPFTCDPTFTYLLTATDTRSTHTLGVSASSSQYGSTATASLLNNVAWRSAWMAMLQVQHGVRSVPSAAPKFSKAVALRWDPEEGGRLEPQLGGAARRPALPKGVDSSATAIAIAHWDPEEGGRLGAQLGGQLCQCHRHCRRQRWAATAR